jgi:hypothetical protein
MISTIPQTPRSLPPRVLSTTPRPLYNPASSLQPRVFSTTPRPLYNPASSLQPASSTIHRATRLPCRAIRVLTRSVCVEPSALHRIFKALPRLVLSKSSSVGSVTRSFANGLPSHTRSECPECLCFGYVYPASTLSVCIRLTWGLKRQITHLTLNLAKLSTTLHHPRALYYSTSSPSAGSHRRRLVHVAACCDSASEDIWVRSDASSINLLLSHVLNVLTVHNTRALRPPGPLGPTWCVAQSRFRRLGALRIV